ncbi:hypothetical protein MFLO_11889 [Listeria floridensis FSL S10-1187]|uniref:DUF2165 domain-containing protein n=1 Tax=Listeria floridensis FSL S10-1187 TaxID=1265817 RepID=A0ABN0RDK0_9LIST|nr:DUF2165 domain-containing protein [Listeria floridensis]EUJ28844.1 hypothetical protein MFLO_11889 [Listeria floridensis FSL S10-1187]
MQSLNWHRLIQILVIFLFGVFATFVFMGNLMDFNSNFEFVRHVLSMDTTFKGNDLMWRAIDNHTIWLIAYWGIIIAEGLVAFLGWYTSIQMLRAYRQPSHVFNKQKWSGYLMFILIFLIWYVGFVVIGSEWFAMWQSQEWNGKETAMGITQVALGMLIVFMMPEKSQAK